jgi:hypothetical protein
MRVARREVEIPASPFGIESVGHGNGFEQSRLAGAVLADEIRDLGMQFQSVQCADGGDAERIGVPIGHAVVAKADVVEERGVHEA